MLLFQGFKHFPLPPLVKFQFSEHLNHTIIFKNVLGTEDYVLERKREEREEKVMLYYATKAS